VLFAVKSSYLVNARKVVIGAHRSVVAIHQIGPALTIGGNDGALFSGGHVACGSEPSTPLKQHIVLIRIANLCKTAVEFSCQGSDHLRTESCRGFLSGHQRLT